MKLSKTQLIVAMIFYGALWGIVEASVGYLLHFLPSLIAGTILFPFAALILSKAYQKCGSNWALLGVGFIAAAIKSFDFLLPVMNVFKVINPMISIVLEALMVFAVINVMNRSNVAHKVGALFIASFGWRALFLASFGIQMMISGYAAPQIQSLSAIADFIFLSGSLSAMIGMVLFVLDHLVSKKWNLVIKITPLVSAITTVFAIILTLVL